MMDALLRLLPPPNPPAPIDWADAERRLGTALPSDLKALVDRYGPGHLAGVIELLSPVEPRSARNLVAHVRRQASWSNTSPTHLLALARDADGGALLWQMTGQPDVWPILGGRDLWRFEGTLSELLLAALEGRAPVPLPVRTGPPPPEPEPDEEGVDVAAALAAMPPRTHNPRALDRLVELVPPPDVDPAGWVETERTLGTALPRDFRALADRYGSGAYGEELIVMAPPRLLERMEQNMAAARALQHHHLDPVTDEPAYRVWPEPRGLLPWADLGNAVCFHWYTGSGSPDDWSVVVEATDSGLPDFWAFDGSATDLLLGIVEGTVEVPQLWEDLSPWTFEAYR